MSFLFEDGGKTAKPAPSSTNERPIDTPQQAREGSKRSGK